MKDREQITAERLQVFLTHADRLGLVKYAPGIVEAWMGAMRGITDAEAAEAFAYFRDNGPPGDNYYIRAHDVRKRALSRRQDVPYHLRCKTHPEQYAYECRDCRKLLAPANAAFVARVKKLAAQATDDARRRDAERADALQRRADEAYARRVTRAEAKRQKAAQAAREGA